MTPTAWTESNEFVPGEERGFERDNAPCRRCRRRFKVSIYERVIDLCAHCERDWREENPYLARTVRLALESFDVVVYKGWGAEIWMRNHDKYCLKYLLFFAGRKFSNHYHIKKQEIWHVLHGGFKLFLDSDPDHDMVGPGFFIEILPGRHHQLEALQDGIVLEVSTQHFDDDSVRIQRGD